jgi:hypothetical protein
MVLHWLYENTTNINRNDILMDKLSPYHNASFYIGPIGSFYDQVNDTGSGYTIDAVFHAQTILYLTFVTFMHRMGSFSSVVFKENIVFYIFQYGTVLKLCPA